MSDPMADFARENGEKYLAEKRAHRETRAKLDTHILDKAFDDVLSDPNIDTEIVRRMIAGSNPRVVDDQPVIDYGGGLAGTPREALDYWRSKPEEYGNITDPLKPREKSPQEKHYDALRDMSDDQYFRGRKKPGFFEPPPEPQQ